MSAVVLGWGPEPSSLQWTRELCCGDQMGLCRGGVSEWGDIHAVTLGLFQANEQQQQQHQKRLTCKQQKVKIWTQIRAGSYPSPDTP